MDEGNRGKRWRDMKSWWNYSPVCRILYVVRGEWKKKKEGGKGREHCGAERREKQIGEGNQRR